MNDRDARGRRLLLVVVACLAVALVVAGPGQAQQLHAARNDLAAARAALRELAAGDEPRPRTFAAGAAPNVRVGRAARDVPRRLDALRRVRLAEAAVDRTVREIAARGLVAGVLDQVRALVRGPADDTAVRRLHPPVRGVVTSGFGPRRWPSWSGEHVHEGIDIFALPGTAVRVAAPGRVLFAGLRPEAGLSVTVDHGRDERGRRLRTVYSHLSSLAVRDGQRVGVGKRLGAVGGTGSHSLGPHLHFEVRLEGEAVDPRAWL